MEKGFFNYVRVGEDMEEYFESEQDYCDFCGMPMEEEKYVVSEIIRNEEVDQRDTYFFCSKICYIKFALKDLKEMVEGNKKDKE